MKKIGIVTLFGYENYGNRLQMYATQKNYEKIGFDAEIIKYKLNFTLLRRIKVIIKYFLKHFLKKYKNASLKDSKLKQNKIKNFEKHANKYIFESKEVINPERIDTKLKDKYDFFSVGSDQIWAPFYSYMLDFSFLKFARKEQRISLSPSFGKSEITTKYIEDYKKGLLGFNHLSVREEAGEKIIKDLTGRDAEVLVDPTMVLDKEEWINFSEVHKLKPSKKYILTYFLGPLPKKVKEIIEANKEYEIVELGSFEMPEFYDANPSEWVDFVKDADLFLTDSFHGVVFAHILKTPFAVYDRIGGKSMGSRISNILKKFNMEDRHELTIDSKSLFNVDFSDVDSIIEKEKEKTMNYLKKVLSINDKK